MVRYLLFALLLALSCVFAGCASDPSTTGNDPYHLEQSGTTAHGEVSAEYGHSVGH